MSHALIRLSVCYVANFPETPNPLFIFSSVYHLDHLDKVAVWCFTDCAVAYLSLF